MVIIKQKVCAVHKYVHVICYLHDGSIFVGKLTSGHGSVNAHVKYIILM